MRCPQRERNSDKEKIKSRAKKSMQLFFGSAREPFSWDRTFWVPKTWLGEGSIVTFLGRVLGVQRVSMNVHAHCFRDSSSLTTDGALAQYASG